MTIPKPSQKNEVYARDREQWRSWLEKNHATEKNVWLILHHKSNPKPSVTYEEAVEEALCFGWIDSKANKRDEESSYQLFAKRNPKSSWSGSNRERAERMIREGRMTEAGMEMISIAKKTGTWTALEDVQSSVIPGDLDSALAENPVADQNFKAFPPSSKKIILGWIVTAKKPETRTKRIEETVRLALKNIRAHHPAGTE